MILRVGFTGTDTSTSAVTVVVALVPFPRRGICGRERAIRLEALRDEVFGIFPGSAVVMHSPYVQDDGGALGQEHAVDFTVWGICQLLFVSERPEYPRIRFTISQRVRNHDVIELQGPAFS